MNLHNLSVRRRRRRRSIVVPFCRHRAKKQRVQDHRGHENQSPHQNLGLDDSQTYGQIITPGSLPSRGLYKVLNSFKKRLVLRAQPQLQSQCVLQFILSSWHMLATPRPAPDLLTEEYPGKLYTPWPHPDRLPGCKLTCASRAGIWKPSCLPKFRHSHLTSPLLPLWCLQYSKAQTLQLLESPGILGYAVLSQWSTTMQSTISAQVPLFILIPKSWYLPNLTDM